MVPHSAERPEHAWMNLLYVQANVLLCISNRLSSCASQQRRRAAIVSKAHVRVAGISNAHAHKSGSAHYIFISSSVHNVPCFLHLLHRCIYISAKCSETLASKRPGGRFTRAISLRYEPLFRTAHGVFYKQGHQIWSLHKYTSKWLHLRTAPGT